MVNVWVAIQTLTPMEWTQARGENVFQMSKTWSPPYLGAAYYPEDWPLEQIDDDIALMKRSGDERDARRRVRLEPDGARGRRFDFDWLHMAVDKLAAAGIATVMCTPTCTPPAWLRERYPEMLFVDPNGKATTHGGGGTCARTAPSTGALRADRHEDGRGVRARRPHHRLADR